LLAGKTAVLTEEYIDIHCAGRYEVHETNDGVFVEYWESEHPGIDVYPNMASLERGDTPTTSHFA